MSLKNLNVKNKTRKLLLNKLKDKRISQIYKKFESTLNINEDCLVALSGGPDSLALSFLAKVYSIKNFLKIKFIIVDHKLRKNSTLEAKFVKKKIKEYGINLKILTWNGKKPNSNIQSVAREKRYNLLISEAKKYKIKNILLGHHLDDVFENFFIRILRGSGLNGLVSLDKKTKNKNINLIRPLLNFHKNDLMYVCKNVFGSFVEDPSNKDEKFKRVKIRNFLKQLEKEGLDKNKLLLTIKNLKFSNETIKFYTRKNLYENVSFLGKKSFVILKENFFYQSAEVVFRSLSEIIKFVGEKYYPVRGKKIERIIKQVNDKSSFKVTLGGCLIKKVHRTVILTKE
tara:strand:+ start:119 stop:1144 length:1026 start_codon:yes stop_codon:yes gene_type:complete